MHRCHLGKIFVAPVQIARALEPCKVDIASLKWTAILFDSGSRIEQKLLGEIVLEMLTGVNRIKRPEESET